MFVSIKAFGGILPAVDKRNLPGNAAQECRNLLANVAHFQPVKADLPVAVSAVNNPQSVYRLDRKVDGTFNNDMTTGWVVNASVVSYVKGPINNDTTERTYYTFDDGSAPPRWLDVTGADRRLGVPQPAQAPITVNNPVDEFTPDDRVSEIEAVLRQIASIIRARLAPTWIGADEPGTAGSTAATGYINVQAAGGYGSPATQGKQARLWGLTSYNGAHNGAIFTTYGGAGDPAQYSWVYDPALQPWWPPSNNTMPAWTWAGSPAGSYRDNIGIVFTAYGLGYTVDVFNLTADLAAIPMPGRNDGTKLFTAAQLSNGSTGIVDRVIAKVSYSGGNPEATEKYRALRQAVDELRTMMNRGMAGASEAQAAAYFASADVTTYMNDQITTWAGRVFDTAAQCIVVNIPADSWVPYSDGP